MKKILYVVTKSNFGGAQRYVFDLATSLPHEEFSILVAAGGNGSLMQKLQEKKIETRSIESFQRDISSTKEIESISELYRLYKKERPDIVHLNSSKAGGTGALIARVCGIKKIVFTVHGFAFNEDRPWYQKFIIKALHYVTLLLCTDVICISKKEFDQAKNWLGIKNKLHLIYNGINEPTLLPREEARLKIAEYIGKPTSFFENKLMIGSIGELTKNKGYTYAIEAIKDLSNSVYVIIGDGEQKNELSDYIIENNQQEKIFLTGYVPHAATVLKAFDVFLISSIKEGIPYVLIEAGVVKVPVISTDVGGIAEILTPEKGTLIPAQKSRAIKEAVLNCIENPLMINKKAEKLQTYIYNELQLSKMVQKTIIVYNN